MQKTRIFFIPVLLALFLMPAAGRSPVPAPQEEQAARIHYSVHTVDTHVDTPLLYFGSELDLGTRNQAGCIDLPRMKAGGLDSIFFAIFLSQGKLDGESYRKVHRETLDLFAFIKAAVRQNSTQAGLAFTPEDAFRLEKEGRRAIFIGIENGYPLADRLARVEQYYRLGARYITLCHSRNNQICDSSTDEPVHGGLSEFGQKVVKEMNRLGMIIDVSHLSDQSFFDVISLSRAPVIASHSCAREICDHPRNMSDAMLKSLSRNGGVIQVCLVSDFVKDMPENPQRRAAFRKLQAKYRDFDSLSDEKKKAAREEWYRIDRQYPANYASVKDLVDHIDHIVNLIGIDHVGIGSDFDGGGRLADCRDVSQIPLITTELVKRGYDSPQIARIWGGNFFRVFREVRKGSAAPRH